MRVTEGLRGDPSPQITYPKGLLRTPLSSMTGFARPGLVHCKDVLCELMKFEEPN